MQITLLPIQAIQNTTGSLLQMRIKAPWNFSRQDLSNETIDS